MFKHADQACATPVLSTGVIQGDGLPHHYLIVFGKSNQWWGKTKLKKKKTWFKLGRANIRINCLSLADVLSYTNWNPEKIVENVGL